MSSHDLGVVEQFGPGEAEVLVVVHLPDVSIVEQPEVVQRQLRGTTARR
jgi:hypothetical protein